MQTWPRTGNTFFGKRAVPSGPLGGAGTAKILGLSFLPGKLRALLLLAVAVTVLRAASLSAQMTQQFPGLPRSPVQNPLSPENGFPATPGTPLSQVAAARAAVQRHPQSGKAYLSLAEALLTTGEEDEALDALKSAVQLAPREAEAWYLKGLIEARRTMWAAARQDFAQAVEARPSFVSARVELGDMLRRTGRFEDAASELTLALTKKSKDALARYDLGLVELQQGKMADAEREFRKALAAEKDFPEARAGLAETLLDEHEWAAAAPIFQDAVADNPDSLELANGLALALSHLGDSARAAAAFQRARALAIRHVGTQRARTENTMGLHYLQAGDAARALAAFQQAVKDAPDFAEARYNLGRLELEESHPGAAIADLKIALGLQKNYPEALNSLGEAYLRSGQSDLAVQSFEDALKIQPGFVAARFNLGMAKIAQGMRNEAEKQFKEVILLAPDTAAAHIELGLLLAQEDGALSSRARKELSEGLRLDPRLINLIPEDLRTQLQGSPKDRTGSALRQSEMPRRATSPSGPEAATFASRSFPSGDRTSQSPL